MLEHIIKIIWGLRNFLKIIMNHLQFNAAVLGEFLRGDKLVRMFAKVGFNTMQKLSAVAFTPTRNELDVFWEYTGSCNFHLFKLYFLVVTDDVRH
jgi:hypothetical protein